MAGMAGLRVIEHVHPHIQFAAGDKVVIELATGAQIARKL